MEPELKTTDQNIGQVLFAWCHFIGVAVVTGSKDFLSDFSIGLASAQK